MMYSPSGRPRRYYPLGEPQHYRDDRVILESSDLSEYETRGNCGPMLKYAIFAFNIISLLVGTIILAMGAWLRVDSRFRDFLSERYRQVVAEEFWQAPTLYTFSYILIVLGATMIVVAMFGCCGVIGGSRLFLGFYAFSVFVLLVFTISCGVYIIYKKDGIDVELSDALNYMVQHYYQGAGVVQESLDRLQQAFRCCGNAGCSDFRAFRQDPPRTCDIRCDGCHYRIMLALRIGFSVALAVFGIVILTQFVAIAAAAVLVFRDQKDDLNISGRPNYPMVHYYRGANPAYRHSPSPRPPQPAYSYQEKPPGRAQQWGPSSHQPTTLSSPPPYATRTPPKKRKNPYALDLKKL